MSDTPAGCFWFKREDGTLVSMGGAGVPGPAGPQGPPGADGVDGAEGPAGPGVPAGGSTFQVLRKNGTGDFVTGWATATRFHTESVSGWNGVTLPANTAVERQYTSSWNGVGNRALFLVDIAGTLPGTVVPNTVVVEILIGTTVRRRSNINLVTSWSGGSTVLHVSSITAGLSVTVRLTALSTVNLSTSNGCIVTAIELG